jgi:hypothetical protein
MGEPGACSDVLTEVAREADTHEPCVPAANIVDDFPASVVTAIVDEKLLQSYSRFVTTKLR